MVEVIVVILFAIRLDDIGMLAHGRGVRHAKDCVLAF